MRARRYKIASVIAAVFVLFIFGYYLFTFNEDDVETTKISEIVVNDTVTAEGVFVRDEEAIYYGNIGQVVLLRDDGEKVSAGSVIAQVYSSDSEVSQQMVVARLDERISVMMRAVNTAQYATSEVLEIDEKIQNLSVKKMQRIAGGKVDELNQIAEEINYLLCRKQMLIATETERIALLEALQSQRRKLAEVVPKDEITTEFSGYYVHQADGYELLLSPESVSTLTPSKIASLLSMPGYVSGTCIGKLVKDFHIDYVAVVSSAETQGITVGKTIEIVFPFDSEHRYEMTVKTVLNEGEKSSVVLRGTTVTEDLLSLRTQSATLIKNSIKGLRIDMSAIRVKDGVVGVYAVRSGVLKFLPIETVATTDEYYVAKWNDSNEKTVMLSDEIVTSGRNLQEGKLVR